MEELCTYDLGTRAANIDEIKLALEDQRAREDLAIKRESLSLQHRQLEIQQKQFDETHEARRNSTVGIPLVRKRFPALDTGVIVGVITAIAALIGHWVQGYNNAQLESKKFELQSRLEHSKFESDLLLSAVKTGDPKAAIRNIQFLIQCKLLTPTSDLSSAIADPKTVAVLPSPEGGTAQAGNLDAVRLEHTYPVRVHVRDPTNQLRPKYMIGYVEAQHLELPQRIRHFNELSPTATAYFPLESITSGVRNLGSLRVVKCLSL